MAIVLSLQQIAQIMIANSFAYSGNLHGLPLIA